MCVIVLRSWTNDRAFVVVVILIANIPIQPLVQLNCQPCLRRLKVHRIRSDQRSRLTSRISYSITLTVVFVDAVSREDCDTRSDTAYGLNIEKVIPDEIETVTKQVLNAIEEIIEFRVAVYPMVVVAGSNREREVAVQSSEEEKIFDFTLTPKSSSETPAISEGFELFLVITERFKAIREVGL